MVRALIHGADSFLDEWLGCGETIEAHTSGSTGKPKAIKLRKEDMRRSARATNAYFGLGPDSRLVCPLSADYIAGKMMVVRAIEAGAELWMTAPHRRNLLDGVPSEAFPVDLLPIVPAQLPGLLEDAHAGQVRNVIIGGAALTPLQEAAAARAPFAAYATYGMTETCSHVALRRIGAGSLFTPLPGVTTATDRRGCLIVNGLVTNDVVDLQPDGRFRWLGRADNVIVSGGLKVHPEEMEQLMAAEMALLSPARFYLTGRPSEEWGEEVVMVVDRAVDESAVMALCRMKLPRHAVPKAIITDTGMTITARGKLLRKRLSDS